MKQLAPLVLAFVLTGSIWAQSTLLVPEEYATPQAAVDAAADGDTVSVGPGVYVGSTSIVGKNVHLISRDGPYATMLDGAGAQVLHISNGVGVTSIIRGFTICNGVASLASGGGGIEVSYSSPYIVNCIVRDNTAWYGGGISLQGGAATVVNCLFESNYAAMDGAAIMGGWATAGVVIANCTVVENVLTTGPLNSAAFVYFNGGDASIFNTIVFDNQTPNLLDWSIRGGTAKKCNVESWPMTGMISEDPLFVDPGLGDHHLQLGSPSRDTGGEALLPPDVADLDGDGDVNEPVPLDLDGNPRSLDTRVDMGCYEADASPVTYCTAKVNSCGTLPAIGYFGQSSAKAPSGFTLSARNIRAGKAGLLVYTSAGQASLPFGGGILCLASPRKRSVPLLDTTGTPPLCDGTLSLDMNAFAQGALGGNPASFLLAPGTRVDVQFWARDTPGNVTLSDALEYWVNP